jgi:P-type Cu2+ transporter
VLEVRITPVGQTATVVFDPSRTSLAKLREWVIECGYHCAGQAVPAHVCDPMELPDPPAAAAGAELQAERDQHAEAAVRSPGEVMGDGGHGTMSMAAMVRDMRNRFLVAAVFAIPILLWSPVGRDVFGLHPGVPFGLREDQWALLLSLPVGRRTQRGHTDAICARSRESCRPVSDAEPAR